jgi:outer membrane lipoprotein-sorting protein
MMLHVFAGALMTVSAVALAGQPASQPALADAAAPDRRAAARLAEFEKGVLDRQSAVTSLTAKVQIAFEGAQNDDWVKSDARGPMECLIRDGKVLSRCELKLETTTTSAGKESKTKAEQLLLNDGDYYYTYGTDQYASEEDKDKKYVFRLPQDPIQSCIVTPAYLDVFKRDYHLRVLDEEQIEGKKVWVVEAVRSSGPEMKTVIYVRRDVPLLVRSVNYDRYGTKIGESTVSDVKLNAKVDPKRFVFTPDPKAEFVDLAEGLPPS